MYKHILLPTDGSALAAKAVRQGIDLAHHLGSKITVLTVTEPFALLALAPEQVEYSQTTYRQHAEEHAKKTLAAVADQAKRAGVSCETVHVEHSSPYEAIIETARSKGCDLIVIASHGRRGVSAIVLGSETVKVLTHSDIPVLVYR